MYVDAFSSISSPLTLVSPLFSSPASYLILSPLSLLSLLLFVLCVGEEISYCCTNYNPTTREQYTDSFLLSFYLSESYSRRARWLSLATEKDNFSCASTNTGCVEDYRRGLIQSFFVLFSFSACRILLVDGRVPKIFFEKKW